MENNSNTNRIAERGNNSNTIFGTSSDDIVQGLHSGAFADTENAGDSPNPDDSSIIVNEQEQNEIVNPAEEEFTEQPVTESSIEQPAKGKQDLTEEVIEGEIIDDEIDNEETLKKAEN